jgi:hypothetical protein
MDNSILSLLKAERTRIEKAIALFEPQTSTPAVQPPAGKPRRHGRHMSAASRAAMSKKLKAIWAAKKAKKAARKTAAKKAS